jgi:outer membrane protein assembly factor BamB
MEVLNEEVDGGSTMTGAWKSFNKKLLSTVQPYQTTFAAGAALASLALLASCSVAVRTYHYDDLRTGWNANEKRLNPSNVSSTSLEYLALALDDANDQVDTQPLIVPHVHIAGGTHDVVYVTTENNNVYAIDANSDTKLLKVNLGTPVSWPIGCGNNGPTVGINGTPVIDLASRTMYVIAYVMYSFEGKKPAPAYFLHALDLATLADNIPPRHVEAHHTLSDGVTTFEFHPRFQRQRPGLLLANGNVYAGFGSFCDWGADHSVPGPLSRGWVLGWQAGSLTPLASNELNDTQTTEPNNMFLSSVWMSGYGIAGDHDGNIFFNTGNSDPSGTTYDGVTNIQESVVKLNADITRPSTPPPFLFTPANVSQLDQGDTDVASAGVMLLPPQPGPVPNLAVANAKDGSMFLLNRDNLGGFTPGNTGALGGVQNIGNGQGQQCWCGPTYFNDGSSHVVSSGGGPTAGGTQNILELWKLQTSPAPALTQTATAAMPDTMQDPGFFTSVSSKGNKNAIIWAVSRPLAGASGINAVPLWLYAFNAKPSGSSLPLLVHAIAGSWSNQALGGNANIVPVVANGKVYVATYKELDIFGIHLPNGQNAASRTAPIEHVVKLEFAKGPEEHQIAGTVRKLEGARFTLETRDHKMVDVDAAKGRGSFRLPVIAVGNGVVAAGSYDANGVLQAETVWRSKASPATWPQDR